MAGREFNFVSTKIATGTSRKCLIMMTAHASAGLQGIQPDISFYGNSPTAEKIQVELVKGAGGGTGTSLTAAKTKGAGSVLATGVGNYSSNPTSGTVLARVSVHPQSGYRFPDRIDLDPGETLAIFVTAAAGVDSEANFLNCRE